MGVGWGSGRMSPLPIFMARRAAAASSRAKTLAEMFPPTLPAFTPSRTVTVTNLTQLNNAIANLAAGDLVNVSAFTAPGEIIWSNKNLASRARFVFAPGFLFSGAASGSQLPSVYMTNCSNIDLIGGDVTGDGNQGIRIDSSLNILWHRANIFDCAGTGLIIQGLTRASTGLDIEAVITNCGIDPALDPHSEPGTGNHGAYIGQDNYPVSGKFVLDVRDQTVGAALQLGQSNNVELWIQGYNITKEAVSQVAGNVLQLWGSVSNLTCHYLKGDHLGGRGVETDGLYGISGSTVEYGRTSDARLSPSFRPVTGLTYVDCVDV